MLFNPIRFPPEFGKNNDAGIGEPHIGGPASGHPTD